MKQKLELDELEIESFATSAAVLRPEPTIGTIIVNPNDPTAATWCYICPVRTQDCY